MNRVRTAWRTVWLSLVGALLVSTPFMVIAQMIHPTPKRTWQGATEGWSPLVATRQVGGPADWDTQALWDASQKALHRKLNQIEDELHNQLDGMLALVYAWRDAA